MKSRHMTPFSLRECSHIDYPHLDFDILIPAVGIRAPSWEYSESTLDLRARSLLRQQPHGRRRTLRIWRVVSPPYDSSLMADDVPYEILASGEPTGVTELPAEWILDDYPYFGMDRYSDIRPYTPPSGRLRGLEHGVRHGLLRGRTFLVDHASADHRPPFANRDAGGAHPVHAIPSRRLVRHS